MFLRNILEKRADPLDDGYYVSGSSGLLAHLIPSRSGIVVTPDIAMTYSGYYACVKVISETMAMLPLIVYRRLVPRGKERDPRHYLYQLLHDEPNPEMTSFQWREIAMVHLLTWGNHYSNIERDNAGRPVALWPLLPGSMDIERDKASGALMYVYKLPSGESRALRAWEVLHIRGMCGDGLKGLSPVGAMREAIALGINTQDFGNEFYKNGMTLSGVLEYPAKLGDLSKKNIKESMAKKHTGMGNRHRFMLLEEGMTFKQIGIPPENAQFLETRKFQLEEMCRIHRLQLHKVQHLEHATYSNIEHQAIEFTTDTVQPWSVRMESELRRQLMLPADKLSHFIEFLLDGLLRGDIQTRYTAYGTALSKGFMAVNDVREKENINPSDQDGAEDLYHENIWYKLGEGPQSFGLLGDGPAGRRILPAVPEVRAAGPGRRNRLREQFRVLFGDAASRVVRIEVNDLRAALKRHFKQRSAQGFSAYLDEYYDGYAKKYEQVMLPVVQAYGAAVAAAAAAEIGKDAAGNSESVAKYAKGYVAVSGGRYSTSSKSQLRKIMAEADAEVVEEELRRRLDEWDERRADKITSREIIEASDAFARQAWVLAGILTFTWVAQGDKPCPFCLELDGMTVGVQKEFVPEGGSVSPEGEGPMVVGGPKFHPPLHDGCVCTIVAG